MDKNAIRADGYDKGKIEEKTEIAKKMKENILKYLILLK